MENGSNGVAPSRRKQAFLGFHTGIHPCSIRVSSVAKIEIFTILTNCYFMIELRDLGIIPGKLRGLGHLRLVPLARPALERERAILPRQDPDVERLRRPPGLR